MIEPVTATAAVYLADRVYSQIARARVRARLLALAPTLPPGSQVGETYGRDAGWYIVTTLPDPAALTSR
jgi:hypothetical protein